MLTKDSDVVQIKAGPDNGLGEGQFTAYASVFNNVDSMGDVVYPGAFAKSLARWGESGYPIPLLFGHQMDDPDMNLGHIVEAVEDDHGLLVTGQLDLANPKATQVYRMIKGRRINQMSYAYDVIEGGPEKCKAADDDDATSDDGEVYALRELKLYEVSVVTIGANTETEILAVKQATRAAAHQLALLKAGRVLSAKNEGELRGAWDSIGRVLSALDSQPKFNPHHDELGRFSHGVDSGTEVPDEKVAHDDDTPAPGHVFGYHATNTAAALSIIEGGFGPSMSGHPVGPDGKPIENPVWFYPVKHNRGMVSGHEMAFPGEEMRVVRGEFPVDKALKVGDPTNPKDDGAFYIVDSKYLKTTKLVPASGDKRDTTTVGKANGHNPARRALKDVHRSPGVNPPVIASLLELEMGLSA